MESNRTFEKTQNYIPRRSSSSLLFFLKDIKTPEAISVRAMNDATLNIALFD